MKLWAVVAVCVLLLSSVSNSPLPASWEAAKKPPILQESEKEKERQISPLFPKLPGDPPPGLARKAAPSHTNMPDHYPDRLDDVMEYIQDTIKRLKRSSNRQTLSKRERSRQSAAAAANMDNYSKKTGKERRRKNRGCVLKEIHLNVTDLDLGYETKEELIFRYCSGTCNAPETTYDQIVKNLTRKKKFANDKVKQACCRPIAFDDDLAFLDDNLVYHTLRQHSARRCGCV
ncbi:hypothetical protein NDU88_005698 [Pleurodeles waltl]|uniref:Glial cell line-derived neurotrophic factor n=1 Tax=Pleurodeles waltl TaxID=8319 RepID=A0AAV7WCK2_PLEWA|nr:hypothetical protein NDU88_005698 [Pleurodeles waltl]